MIELDGGDGPKPREYGGAKLAAHRLWLMGVGKVAPIIRSGISNAGSRQIIQVTGDDFRIDNVFFRGKTAEYNGASVYLMGNNATFFKVDIEGCQNGLMASGAFSGTLVVERCAFRNNGLGGYLSHPIYASGGEGEYLIVRNSTFGYNSTECNHIRSRHRHTIVEYCTFGAKDDRSSRALNTSSEADQTYTVRFVGNVVLNPTTTGNSSCVGLDKRIPLDRVEIGYNTFVCRRTYSRIVRVVSKPAVTEVANNLIVGRSLADRNTISGALRKSGPGDLVVPLEADVFVNPSANDFRLKSDGPAVGAAVKAELVALRNPDWTRRDANDVGAWGVVD